MDILKLAKENESLVISLRHYLHQHPELSGQEFETLRFLRQKLEAFGVPYVASGKRRASWAFSGDEHRGRTVLLRADMDALPMQESPDNTKQPKRCPISQVPGVAHTCGHDAHTAMLLTAAKILREHEAELPGRVILCFERGEEGGNNLEFILRYLEAEHIRVDACHALHVAPGLEAGKIAALYGPTTAGNFSFDVTITGKGGHGSRPDLSNNPLDCFHAFYGGLQSIWMRDVSPCEPATLAICKVQYGTTWNIIAPTLNFAGNGRVFSQETSGMGHPPPLLGAAGRHHPALRLHLHHQRHAGPLLRHPQQQGLRGHCPGGHPQKPGGGRAGRDAARSSPLRAWR